MRPVFLVVVGACIAGCPGPTDPATPDGSLPTDSPAISDGPSPDQARLNIAWTTIPTIPGVTPGGHTYDEVRFRMENFKATLDVDPQCSSCPSKSEYKLRWVDNESPEAIVFEDAPAGHYETIKLELDEGDGEESFEFLGTTAGGNTFKIDDNTSIPILMDCDFTLEPGAEKTITIEINLGPPIDAVNFADIDSGDGFDEHLDGDDEPEAMADFRPLLQQAFSVRAGDP